MPRREHRSGLDDRLLPGQREQRRAARRRSRRWGKISAALAAAALVLLVAALILALRFNFSWMLHRRRLVARERLSLAASQSAPHRAAADLAIADVAIRGSARQRRIAGTIHNKSRQAYADVQLTLFVRDRRGAGLGYVRALLSRVEASADVPFQTDVLPGGVERFEFDSLTGTPVQ